VNEEAIMIDSVKATTFADPVLVSEPIQGYLVIMEIEIVQK